MTGEPTGAEDLDRLAQAFVEQARRGETPSVESVAKEHPALADDIRKLFPVLALVEGLKAESVSPAPHAPALPDRIGDYTLGCELGRGGMGTVYEGRRGAEGDGPGLVAVKVVHPHLLERPEYIARFLREAAAGGRVTHENVVRTLATGLVDVGAEEVPYILLEHVDGQNLRALLREVEVVPERLCRHVGARLADALAAVHAAGLVHRDVKPENVVITLDETVKLMDLGVAVVQDRLQRLSRTGEFVGSLLYAAPGQMAGEPPDPRWDLHALGILLYELATGVHPARNAGLRWLRANEAARDALTHYDALEQLSPFFGAVIESLLAAEDDASLDSATTVRDVLLEGEASSWWKARRDAAVTPAARLGRIFRPTAFYGRKAEWKVLDAALAAAVDGQGRVVLVEGEAGIGKSRLLYEWTASHRHTQDPLRTVLLTNAPGAAADAEPQLAAALAHILGEEDLDTRLAALLDSRARLAPELARRLRGEPVAHAGAACEAGWLSLLQALARDRPVLVLAEDLHFASSEDIDRFLYFARGAASPGLLLVGTFRPDPEPHGIRELGLLEHVQTLRLSGLDTEASHQLLLDASSKAPRLGESIQSIAERSDRNPMFLLELSRHTHDRVGVPVSGETIVPDSIRGFLIARVAALDPADRELLDTAACQGYEFDPVVVAEASGTGRVEALKRFARMEHGRHLLRAAGRLYQFTHHLVQEVLYADLHPALRETYHASIGEALERRTQQARGGDAVALCTHLLKGGRGLHARPHLRPALEHLSLERMSYAAASDLASMALSVEGLLEGTDRAFALCLRSQTLISEARHDEAQEALAEALSLCEDDRDPGTESHVLSLLAWLAGRRQRPAEALELLERSVPLAHATNDVGREAAILSRLAVELVNRGRYDEAEARSRQASEVLGEADEPFVRCRLTSDLASLRILQGRLEEAQTLLSKAKRLAHEIGDISTEFLNAAEVGRLAFRRGRYHEARVEIGNALELGRRMGMHHRDAFHLLNIGKCHLRLGRFDEAVRHLRESREIARRGEEWGTAMTADLYLSAARAAQGDLRAALEDLASARACAKETEESTASIQIATQTAELFALLGRLEEADRVLDEGAVAADDQAIAGFVVAWTAARGGLRAREGRFAEAIACHEEAEERARRASLLALPHGFDAACAQLETGHRAEAEARLQEVLAWARENDLPSYSVLSQAHLASAAQGDALAARVALERHADRLTAVDRIEAHLALWEADAEYASLEAARAQLDRLVQSAPPEDREAMRTRVHLFRRVADACASHEGPQA